jgi:hypothetical protein
MLISERNEVACHLLPDADLSFKEIEFNAWT